MTRVSLSSPPAAGFIYDVIVNLSWLFVIVSDWQMGASVVFIGEILCVPATNFS